LGGFVISAIRQKHQIYAAVLVVILSVFLNWGYFRPKSFYTINDSEKLSGEAWDLQRKGAILDYLPKTALEPREAASDKPIIRSGWGEITGFVNRTNRWKFTALVKSTAKIEVPVYYFPNWVVEVDGKAYPLSYDNLLGRISVTLNPGSYEVRGYFRNTPLRMIANIISLASAVIFVGYIKYGKNQKNII
jgi:hypothetical protein